MNQANVSFDNQLVKTRTLPKNTLLQNAKGLSDTRFYKMLQVEKSLNTSKQAETLNHENSVVMHPYEDTRSFLEQEGLEDIDGAFELLNQLITNSQEDYSTIGFIQGLLGSNPSETIQEALSHLDHLLNTDVSYSELHFATLPPVAEGICTLNGILKNGLATSFEGLTNDEKKAVLSLLNFGKLIVMSNEHVESNSKVTENVNQLGILLSKWREKLSSINEKRPAESTHKEWGTYSIKEIGQKQYDQQSGNAPLKNKFESTIFESISHQVKSADIPLNQTVMIGELQWQTQQKSPVLALEKGGQTIEADEFIKTFESILSKANYTNQNGFQRLFVKLAPENLGTLHIELVQKDGQMIAKIIANTHKGKELLESQLQGLKVTLASQGIQFDKIDYRETSDAQFQGEYTPRDRQNQHENQHDSDHETGNQEEESFTGFSSALEESLINQEI